MCKANHLKVLIKKNFLTLARNICFLLFFILLPAVTMGLFVFVKKLVSTDLVQDYYNVNEFFFTTSRPLSPNLKFSNTDLSKLSSLVSYCIFSNNLTYAIVGDQSAIDDLSYTIGYLNAYNLNYDLYPSVEQLFTKINDEAKVDYCFGIEVQKFDTTNDEYTFSFLFQRGQVPDTNAPAFDPSQKSPNFQIWSNYMRSGFMDLYMILYNNILSDKGLLTSTLDLAYIPIKVPAYNNLNPLAISQLSTYFPFFFMFTFLIPLYYLVSKFAEEKESKAREGMKMMGLKDATYFFSWFIFYLVVILVMSIIMTVLVGINVFSNSNAFLIFLLALFYGLSLFGFSILIVAFIPTQRSSATAATLFHLVSYFVVYAVKAPTFPFYARCLMSLLPNIAMSYSIYNLFYFEYQSSGLTFDSAGDIYENFSFYAGLGMLIVDIVWFLLLGLYVDQIKSSQYGIAKPWYFLCTRKFWCQKKRNRNGLRDEQDCLINNDLESTQLEIQDPKNFEAIPESLKKQERVGDCLKICNLRKEYGEKVAVDNTSITMYNGQIFALLGHNGAGKTTTISMLTGLIEKTLGSAKVFDIDIFNEMDELRKILGVCPQHDILFDYLTPKEHLQIYAVFKGTPPSQVNEQVDRMIDQLDLVDVKNQIAKQLSGGQKRKLSVGIAMIGNSKLVILDEPTSGMDTSSRRRLWEMLKQNKSERIVILTTHYMDEADILGDRIGIMAEGKVKCCGSSLFLKKRFGVGYNLVIAKKSRDAAPHIDNFIFDRVPSAIKLSEVSSEMAFQLPNEASSMFKDFFFQLDQSLNDLGIRSYGVGITTLEEVFLKIGKGEDELVDLGKEIKEHRKSTLNKGAKKSMDPLENYSIAENKEEGTFSVFLENFIQLFKKKLLLQVRDKRTLLIEIVFPIIIIMAGLGLSKVQVFSQGAPRYMSPTIFPSPNPLIYNKNSPLGGKPQDFVNSIFAQKQSEWRIDMEADLDISSGNFTKISIELNDILFNNQGKNGAFYGNYLYWDLDDTRKNYAVAVMANATSQDSLPVYGQAITEGFLQKATGNSKLQFNIVSRPFPLTVLEQSINAATVGSLSSILFSIAYMMVSDSIIQNVIKERQKNLKHQMIISGTNLPAYWLSHYLGDVIFQMPASAIAIIGYIGFAVDIPDAWILFLIFIFSNPVFVYFFSFLFDQDSTGSIVTRIFYILIGGLVPIVVSVLQVIPDTIATGNALKWVFYVVPIYSLDFGIVALANRRINAFVEKRPPYGPLEMQTALPSVIFLAAAVPFYWILVILIEAKAFRAIKKCLTKKNGQLVDGEDDSTINEDEDVQEENKKVALSSINGFSVRVNQLMKSYGKIKAVRQVSFGLDYGECFALLGVSGAGKTSTFKCLTGEENPTRGELHINGYDLTQTKSFSEARRLIGYCPQFDAIFEGMTVKEHLKFYATIKGVSKNLRDQIIEKQIREMDLEDYVNVRAEKLSGGNKRKLSVAMALIGNPPIVFLDEPSTGVDPQAKRFMWNIVSKISTERKKSTVILTTHSMDEAEALCTKMGIMVAGKFACFGSSQHIKDKYGTGYEIEIKIKSLSESEIKNLKEEMGIQDITRVSKQNYKTVIKKFDAEELNQEISEEGKGSEYFVNFKQGGTVQVEEFMKWVFTEKSGNLIIKKFGSLFKEMKVVEHINNNYKIKVSRDNFSIGYLFGMMEDIKVEYQVSEYSVSQTSLEQIFNNFNT